jgi:hypothetical protein
VIAADRRRAAYHESGHAVVGMLTPDADPVRKVSIVPHGQALGITFSVLDSDRLNYERDQLEARVSSGAWGPLRRGAGVRPTIDGPPACLSLARLRDHSARAAFSATRPAD